MQIWYIEHCCSCRQPCALAISNLDENIIVNLNKMMKGERGMIERGAQRGFSEISARTDRLHSDAHNPAFVSSSLY